MLLFYLFGGCIATCQWCWSKPLATMDMWKSTNKHGLPLELFYSGPTLMNVIKRISQNQPTVIRTHWVHSTWATMVSREESELFMHQNGRFIHEPAIHQGCSQVRWVLPSGELTYLWKITMLLMGALFLWSFSIANYRRLPEASGKVCQSVRIDRWFSFGGEDFKWNPQVCWLN